MNKIKINFKSLLFHLLIPLMFAFIISMLIGDFSTYYESIDKPINVSPIVFPIVWSVLYLLMGTSAYLVDNSNDEKCDNAMRFYYLQLILNLLWTPVFFYFKWQGISLILTIMLVFFVFITSVKFYKINRLSGYLFIPYFLWCSFALYLTSGVYFLNLK